MRLFERVADLLENRRIETRHPVLADAEFRQDSGASIGGILLNLSRSGAMMAAADRPEIGDHGQILFHGIRSKVRVAWAEGYRFGLMFDHALDEERIAGVVERFGSNSRAR